MNEECCNYNCNQGRDCPLRVSQRSLAEEITEGFKALEAMRNTKPVAWMLVDPNWNDFCRYSSYPTKGAIPLYTHSAKTLTDEEIDNVSDEVVPHIDTYAGRREFARLILKKASEK